ncbi:MAG: hypothetical protein ACE14T_07425 [Syntrophales bacterium]
MQYATHAEDYAKFSREGFELMFQGLDMYNKITKSLLDYAELLYKRKPEDIAKVWAESLSSTYKDLLDMSLRPLRMLGIQDMPGKESWDAVFNTWQKFLDSVPVVMAPPKEGIDESVKLSREMHEHFSRLYSAWLDYVQRMGSIYKAASEKKGDGQTLRDSLESSENLMNAWASFVNEEGKDLFRYWKSMVLKESAT